MSETGFRQEQNTEKSIERPKPSPRDTNKPTASSSSSPSQGDRSPVGYVQILPESKPVAKPEKPSRSFTVRYDPNSTDAAASVGSLTKPKQSVLAENTKASTTRPVPRPRPRSMVVSRSEPLNISAMQDPVKYDKPQPLDHPVPANRPVVKSCDVRPVSDKKGYHVVGSSIWYDGDKRVPPQRPPPVKPKPAVSPTNIEADKADDSVPLASAKVPPDVVRRKPTIIRATLTAEQTVSPSATTTALPSQSQTAVSIAVASTVVTSVTETNGWNKPTPHVQQSGSNTVGQTSTSESAKPQPKKRPTIIRMNRPELSNTESPSEPPLDSADQKQSRALTENSVEVSRNTSAHGSESHHSAVLKSQRSADQGSLLPAVAKPETENRDLKPVPRSQSHSVYMSEQELSRKIPPAKPPPPTASNTVEEQKTSE